MSDEQWAPRELPASELREGDLIVYGFQRLDRYPTMKLVRIADVTVQDDGTVVPRYTSDVDEIGGPILFGVPNDEGYAADRPFLVLARGVGADTLRPVWTGR